MANLGSGAHTTPLSLLSLSLSLALSPSPSPSTSPVFVLTSLRVRLLQGHFFVCHSAVSAVCSA